MSKEILVEIVSTILISVVVFSASAGGAIARNAKSMPWGNGYRWGDKVTSHQRGLPEYELLRQNDNLFPGMNRTYAMRLEAETGHLTPQMDAALRPMLKRRQQSQLAPMTVRAFRKRTIR